MPFNSRPFLFVFFPFTLGLLIVLQRFRRWDGAKICLLGASALFYAYGDRAHLWLFLVSAGINYIIGRQLLRPAGVIKALPHTFVFILGLLWNFGILGYVKYGAFLMAILNRLIGTSFFIHPMALPLGISYYTFTQLMFLIDCHAGLVEKPYRLIDYALFATFFPYTTAGPLVKHEEIIPQIESGPLPAPFSEIAFGGTLFVLGLFKKAVIADGLAKLADPAFGAVQQGMPVSMLGTWIGALSFALQLYFDFSGYSDMAVGLGKIMNIQLPYNFNSPFKAVNAVDFWKRWHMSLTHFLTNYIYNPIVLRWTRARLLRGASTLQKGQEDVFGFVTLAAVPTMITMIAAGIWHGVGGKYICFGLLHGGYLVTNHASRILRRRNFPFVLSLPSWISCPITFMAVMVSFVFFRASDVGSACKFLSSMVRWNNPTLFPHPLLRPAILVIAGLLGVVWFLPNSQELCALALNKSPVDTHRP